MEITQEQFDQLAGRLHTLEEENKAMKVQLEKVVKADENKPVEEEKIVIPDKKFSVDGGAEYQFIVGKFMHKGQSVTATDALNDEDILAHLVNKKSGIIKEVVK